MKIEGVQNYQDIFSDQRKLKGPNLALKQNYCTVATCFDFQICCFSPFTSSETNFRSKSMYEEGPQATF